MNSGYTLDGYDLLAEWNCQVQEVTGHLDFPERKDPTEYDWPDEDGIEAYTDESDIVFKARDITLKCFMTATTRANFMLYLNSLRSYVTNSGLHDLVLKNADNTYEVFWKKKSAFNRLVTWNSTKNVGSFYLVFTEPSPIYPAIWRGLSGSWTLNSTDGADDQTSHGNDGTLINAPSYTTDRKAAANGALALNGTTQYVDVGDTDQTVKSVVIWVYPDDNTSRDIIDFDGGTHILELSAVGNLTATGFSSPSYYVNGVSGQAVAASAWQMLAVTTETGFEASDLDIGKETNYFDGKIEDVRIYDRVLSVEEILVLYHTYNGSLDI